MTMRSLVSFLRPIFYRAIFRSKKIWSTISSIQAKKGSRATLLLLAHFGKDGTMEMVIPNVTQDLLAARVGTTRSRINFFMNKFRKLGFIEYNGNLKVHSSLLNVVVLDRDRPSIDDE